MSASAQIQFNIGLEGPRTGTMLLYTDMFLGSSSNKRTLHLFGSCVSITVIYFFSMRMHLMESSITSIASRSHYSSAFV